MKREFRSITRMSDLAKLDDLELQDALPRLRTADRALYDAWLRRDWGYDDRCPGWARTLIFGLGVLQGVIIAIVWNHG